MRIFPPLFYGSQKEWFLDGKKQLEESIEKNTEECGSGDHDAQIEDQESRIGIEPDEDMDPNAAAHNSSVRILAEGYVKNSFRYKTGNAIEDLEKNQKKVAGEIQNLVRKLNGLR